MTRRIRCRPEDLPRLIEEDNARVKAAIKQSLNLTAIYAIVPIKKRAPKAFGKLQDSVVATAGDSPLTIVDAPHAAAVEVGSRPHEPDFEAVLAWVRLRGLQGTTPNGRLRRHFYKGFASDHGTTTARQARAVAHQLVQKEKQGKSFHDATIEIAQAICAAIKANGTAPHWYVRASMPEIGRYLKRVLRREVKG